MLFERLLYATVLAPFVLERLSKGSWPSTPWDIGADILIGILILAFILLREYTKNTVERVDALRETLNQAIIHDLKNPMTSIIGGISVVLEEDLDEAAKGKLLRIALHSCHLQMELLETLVDTSRLEFGELAPRLGPIRGKALVESCLKEIGGLASHLGVVIEKSEKMSGSGTFVGDEDLLRRVLINLLQNAVKYTPKGGAVSLSITEEPDAIAMVVRDSGIGLSREQIARLFKKYYRVEGGDQSVRRGSGIGLYFSKLVVEAHGGTIAVDSKPGSGTVVQIRLPRRPAGKEERQP